MLASSGKPLAGAEVALFPHETGEVAARTRTDAAGRFRLNCAGAVHEGIPTAGEDRP